MLYFVINPYAGSNDGQRIWKEIERILMERGEKYKCYRTKRPKDMVYLARKLTRGTTERRIVVVGGDGTINEFLNGMLRVKNIKLGFIPVGSGNDFARGMKISKDFKKELRKIISNKSCRNVDYGIIQYQNGKMHRFFVSSGMGYDARICYEADHTKIKQILNFLHLGKLVYLLIGIRYLIFAETFSATLIVDDKRYLEGDGFLFVSFHNLPYEGGGFCFCPQAKTGDGKMNICVAKGIPKWRIPFIIPLAAIGRHTGCRGVYQFEFEQAKMIVQNGQYIHTDGEAKKNERNIQISVAKEKILFMN